MNRYEEAFDELKEVLYLPDKYLEKRLNILQELVRKATPKKPDIYTDTRNYISFDGNCDDVYSVNVYECPRCGSYIADCDEANNCGDYCTCCGQKFDWSEEENVD